jgi:hypothetical protein
VGLLGIWLTMSRDMANHLVRFPSALAGTVKNFYLLFSKILLIRD